jgi:hypothetical protein
LLSCQIAETPADVDHEGQILRKRASVTMSTFVDLGLPASACENISVQPGDLVCSEFVFVGPENPHQSGVIVSQFLVLVRADGSPILDLVNRMGSRLQPGSKLAGVMDISIVPRAMDLENGQELLEFTSLRRSLADVILMDCVYAPTSSTDVC